MLLQLNPKIKILSENKHSCVMLLNNKKIILHGENYQKYFFPLIKVFRKAITLDRALAIENYKSNEITKIKIVINKLINKKILIFAGYEKIRSQSSLKVLLINFSQDDFKNNVNIVDLFSKNNVNFINSDSLALECEELQDFEAIYKEVAFNNYDVVCPIFWYLCPKIIKDITKYTKMVIPVVSNSNYFSYGPLINKNNLDDSMLSLNAEEHRYKYVDYHYSRRVNILPVVFLANEIKQWETDSNSELYNCNILDTICSYNYNSQVFKKKHIVWVRENGN
ncbi:MAG: hypothetical protein ACI4T3_00950 [Lactobacillus sp.]